MVRMRMENGIKIPLSSEEETQRDKEESESAVKRDIFFKEEYKRNRATEYPVIGDQLDNLWKWAVKTDLIPDASAKDDTPEKMAADIAAVKIKHPKPE